MTEEKKKMGMVVAIKNDLAIKIPAISDALPQTIKKYLTPERLTKVALMAIMKNETLQKCSRASILNSVIELAQLGLEPGGVMGRAYLVPYWDKKTNGYNCQPQIGYRGYLALARRSGQLKTVTANVVYEADEFNLDLASESPPVHKPRLKGDRGKPFCAYCIAIFQDGGRHVEVMTVDEIEAIHHRSQSYLSALRNKYDEFGPWTTDWNEMAKKTVVRRAAKYWPISIELADAMELDNKSDTGITMETLASEPAQEEPKSRTQEALDALRADTRTVQVQDNTKKKPGRPPKQQEIGADTDKDKRLKLIQAIEEKQSIHTMTVDEFIEYHLGVKKDILDLDASDFSTLTAEIEAVK